jgi:hypothetical protein
MNKASMLPVEFRKIAGAGLRDILSLRNLLNGGLENCKVREKSFQCRLSHFVVNGQLLHEQSDWKIGFQIVYGIPLPVTI